MARDILALDGRPFRGKPHGWIQHKGSNLCIDLHCACGEHLHFDGDFFYHWKCPKCGRHYTTGSHVAMWEMTPEEVAKAQREGWNFVELDDLCST